MSDACVALAGRLKPKLSPHSIFPSVWIFGILDLGGLSSRQIGLGLGDVDVTSRNGSFGQHRDLRPGNRYETAAHGESFHITAGFGNPDLARYKRPDEGFMAREEGKLAATSGTGNHLGALTRIEDVLW